MVLMNDKKNGSVKLSQPIRTGKSPKKPLTSHIKGRSKHHNPLISTEHDSQHQDSAAVDTENVSLKVQSQPSEEKAKLVTFRDIDDDEQHAKTFQVEDTEKNSEPMFKEPVIPDKTENYHQASNRAQQRMLISRDAALVSESMRSGNQ